MTRVRCGPVACFACIALRQCRKPVVVSPTFNLEGLLVNSILLLAQDAPDAGVGGLLAGGACMILGLILAGQRHVWDVHSNVFGETDLILSGSTSKSASCLRLVLRWDLDAWALRRA